jgi:hypothetical protein
MAKMNRPAAIRILRLEKRSDASCIGDKFQIKSPKFIKIKVTKTRVLPK